MIVDTDNSPEKSILFVASIILKILSDNNKKLHFMELYDQCEGHNITYSLFYYSLDWLFMLNRITSIDSKGEIRLCD